MQNNRPLSEMNVVISGLAYTSRTETLEAYFKAKTASLTVIALSSCFLKESLSYCKVYEKGELVQEFKLANFRIKDYKWFRQPLLIFVFLGYFIEICRALKKVKKSCDLYIGISYSFALWGAILKSMGVAKRLIYYCIDYYIPATKFDFNKFFIKIMNFIERFTVRSADYVWDISWRISEFREKIGGIKAGSYKNVVVPLGYSIDLRKSIVSAEINSYEIGFIGSISANQGLQLLVEAMPDILNKLPQVKVTIIGQGPFLNELKKLVSLKKLENAFEFLGFIKDETRALNRLSSSALSIALYSENVDNANIVCADPGKIKLYLFSGLPVVTTKYSILAPEIEKNNAGALIDYDAKELETVIVSLLNDKDRLSVMRENARKLGEQFISDNIFDRAIIAQMGNLA